MNLGKRCGVRPLALLALAIPLCAGPAHPATDAEGELIVALPDDTTNMDPRIEMAFPFVTRWVKVNDLTVRIHTSEPSPTLWDFIGREPLVPKDYTIKNGVEAVNDRAVGTGPWKLVEWRRKDSMRLERNSAYWGLQPQFARLRLQVIPEAGARVAALRAGQRLSRLQRLVWLRGARALPLRHRASQGHAV